MDSVSFINTLNTRLRSELTDKELAELLTQAAYDVLGSAAAGAAVKDDLTKVQTGTIQAALLWNYQPMIRQAVRTK